MRRDDVASRGPGLLRPPASLLRCAADLLRAGAGVSFVLAAVGVGFVGAALFALVLLGVTVPRALRLPPALDLGLCGVLLVAAWSALLGWYDAYAWLDVVVHAVATGLLAATVYLALTRAGLLASPAEPALAHPRSGALVSVVFIGLGLGVLWELGEWYGQTHLDPDIRTGYGDTIGDLTMGGVGALLAGAALVGSRRADSAGSGPAVSSARTRQVDRVGQP